MKKILYLTVVDSINEPGIYKKITSQKKALNDLGCKVDLSYLSGGEFFLNEKCLGKEFQSKFIRFKNRFIYPKVLCDYLFYNVDKYDVVYIRKSFINNSFIKLMSYIKSKGVKVVLDVPTYPYSNELKGINKVLYIWELLQLKKLKGNIDLVTYIGTEEIDVFDIPSYRFFNGIDVSSVTLKKAKSFDDTLRFIAVANLAEWHGYERFFSAMSNYSKNVEFHIVGEGPALAALKNKAKELNLEKSVFFHGNKLGKDLDDLFDLCDIGIDSLAMYKAGLFLSSSLKAREYAARGIPFILACEDYDFPESSGFVFHVPNDNSDISIDEISSWHSDSCLNASVIRSVAEEKLDWSKIMRGIMIKINNL